MEEDGPLGLGWLCLPVLVYIEDHENTVQSCFQVTGPVGRIV